MTTPTMSDQRPLDVRLRIHVRRHGDQEKEKHFTKRLPVTSIASFKQLAAIAFAIAMKHNIEMTETPAFWYSSNNIEVADDEDLQLAIQTEGSRDPRQLILNFRAPAHYVIAKHGSIVNLSEASPEALEALNKPVADEEMKGDDGVPCRGRRSKTGGKLQRRALKMLIHQELNKASRDVFNALLASKAFDGGEVPKTDAEMAANDDNQAAADLENLCGFRGGPRGRRAMRRERMGHSAGKDRRAGRFKHLVGDFLNKMGVENADVDAMFKRTPGQRGPRQDWKLKRAVIVKKPEEILEAVPGQCNVATIEVQNETKWPWKRSCVITLDDAQTETDMPIEFFSVPIEEDVMGMQSTTIEVPLVVRDNVAAGEKEYEIFMTFRGPRGNPFGERIPIKIKVAEPQQVTGSTQALLQQKAQTTDAEIYKLAIKLFKANLGVYGDILQVVRKNNGDEEASLKELSTFKTPTGKQ